MLRLHSFTAGRHRLRVRAPGGAFGDLEITRDLDLNTGENHATVALSLAAWRGEIPAAFREGRHELLHERDGWQIRTHLHAGDDGSVHAPKTPVGDAWLRRVRADGVDRIRLETIVP